MMKVALSIPNAKQKLSYLVYNKCNKSTSKDCGSNFTCPNCDYKNSQAHPMYLTLCIPYPFLSICTQHSKMCSILFYYHEILLYVFF